MVDEPLTVVVDGTSIIVTMLSTDYSVTYQKQFANPHLVLTHRSITASGPAPVSEAIHQFRARAFHAAVEKARGWAGLLERSQISRPFWSYALGTAIALSLLGALLFWEWSCDGRCLDQGL